MGRPPCCDESGVKKGPWTPEEDEKLTDYINKHGQGSWRTLAKRAGLNRCGKSCRLRWTNYLRPDIKRGKFTEEDERLIINLHSVLGNKWSKIAGHLPGRTDNEIKNFWNTNIRKKLLQMGIDPETHKPRTDYNHLMNLANLIGMSNFGNNVAMNTWSNPLGLQADVAQLAKLQQLQNMFQIMNNSFFNIGNPSFLGNLSLNNPFDAILKGTNIIQTTEPAFLRSQEYANPCLLSQAHSDSSKSWTYVEGGSNPQEFDCNKVSNTSLENKAENPLPALVACSPEMETFNQMENGFNTAQTSIQSPSNTFFDDWEKFLDNQTSSSYWKEILDLTSSSGSPISW
ncbi:unnamed protein product [Lupinus luteus]|uniref:Uncharacterized protein n=1 Tax=Lupinus luteus TaxID=3873 RepID=A0AAV1WR74_LUPLU